MTACGAEALEVNLTQLTTSIGGVNETVQYRLLREQIQFYILSRTMSACS
jgi:hypothetical protein